MTSTSCHCHASDALGNDREAVIGALLELLEYKASRPEEQSKFKDLTVKCLIKVTKSLDEDMKTDRTTRALVTASTSTPPIVS